MIGTSACMTDGSPGSSVVSSHEVPVAIRCTAQKPSLRSCHWCITGGIQNKLTFIADRIRSHDSRRACAEVPSLAEVLDRPAAVAESLLFPFDGGVRPMTPAFAASNGGTGAPFHAPLPQLSCSKLVSSRVSSRVS